MLFNSFEFLFGFLPVTLWVFWRLNAVDRGRTLGWLTIASLGFYGWWEPRSLLFLGGSLLLNHRLSLWLERWEAEADRKWLTIVGVGANLGFLGYFKYIAFVSENLNAIFGTDWPVPKSWLPIGISFFTFHQIAYLLSRYRRVTGHCGLREYSLYVTFFPQLIAGPIVRPEEMLPQLETDSESPVGNSRCSEHLVVGLTLFAFGLFKKTVLADGLIQFSAPVFKGAEVGLNVGFFEAWCAAIAYSLQLYFDFSGYSDMAIGLGRMCGIRLPANFESPYQATDISDFWRRWHQTLSRFIRDYLYIPLGGSRVGPVRQAVNLMITMLVAGLWHGAGWTFVLWGGLHGMYLVIFQIWRATTRRWGWEPRSLSLWRTGLARGITLMAVVCAWVLFKAETLHGAWFLLRSMVGLDGLVLPKAWLEGVENSWGWMTQLQTWGVEFASQRSFRGWSELRHLAALSIIALFAPNTRQLLESWEPVLESRRSEQSTSWWNRFVWQPTPLWAGLMAAATLFAILQFNRTSEFLYFQF